MVSLCPVWMPASPRSSEDRVLASEARCVGSNPAGGAITGSKAVHIYARFRAKGWSRRIGAVAVAMAMLALMAAAVACDPEKAQPTGAPPSATAVMPSPPPSQAPTVNPGPAPTIEPTPASTPASGLTTIQQVLNSASAAMDALKSGSIRLENKTKLEIGLFPIETDVVVTGDFQAPDRSQFTVAISSLGLSIQYEAIIIGQEAYQKLPFSDMWEPGPDALAFLGESGYLGQLNLNLDNEVIQLITLVGSEVLEGDAVYYLKGALPTYAVAEFTGDPTIREGSESDSVDIELWIGVDDLLVRKLALKYQRTDSTSGDRVTVETVVTYSSYDKPVDIQAP